MKKAILLVFFLLVLFHLGFAVDWRIEDVGREESGFYVIDKVLRVSDTVPVNILKDGKMLVKIEAKQISSGFFTTSYGISVGYSESDIIHSGRIEGADFVFHAAQEFSVHNGAVQFSANLMSTFGTGKVVEIRKLRIKMGPQIEEKESVSVWYAEYDKDKPLSNYKMPEDALSASKLGFESGDLRKLVSFFDFSDSFKSNYAGTDLSYVLSIKGILSDGTDYYYKASEGTYKPGFGWSGTIDILAFEPGEYWFEWHFSNTAKGIDVTGTPLDAGGNILKFTVKEPGDDTEEQKPDESEPKGTLKVVFPYFDESESISVRGESVWETINFHQDSQGSSGERNPFMPPPSITGPAPPADEQDLGIPKTSYLRDDASGIPIYSFTTELSPGNYEVSYSLIYPADVKLKQSRIEAEVKEGQETKVVFEYEKTEEYAIAEAWYCDPSEEDEAKLAKHLNASDLVFDFNDAQGMVRVCSKVGEAYKEKPVNFSSRVVGTPEEGFDNAWIIYETTKSPLTYTRYNNLFWLGFALSARSEQITDQFGVFHTHKAFPPGEYYVVLSLEFEDNLVPAVNVSPRDASGNLIKFTIKGAGPVAGEEKPVITAVRVDGTGQALANVGFALDSGLAVEFASVERAELSDLEFVAFTADEKQGFGKGNMRQRLEIYDKVWEAEDWKRIFRVASYASGTELDLEGLTEGDVSFRQFYSTLKDDAGLSFNLLVVEEIQSSIYFSDLVPFNVVEPAEPGPEPPVVEPEEYTSILDALAGIAEKLVKGLGG